LHRVLQTYGNEPLSAMVAWLRHTARQLGHQSPLEAPLLATMETHTYQEVQHTHQSCIKLQRTCMLRIVQMLQGCAVLLLAAHPSRNTA
jgi:hypothetical protein